MCDILEKHGIGGKVFYYYIIKIIYIYNIYSIEQNYEEINRRRKSCTNCLYLTQQIVQLKA